MELTHKQEKKLSKVFDNPKQLRKWIDDVYQDMINRCEKQTQKMIDQYGEDSDLVKSIDKYSLQESIWAKCYYLDDISLLDEDSYFEKIKADIHKIDENDIIENIVTAGIIDIYNSGGMEAVNEYIEKGK